MATKNLTCTIKIPKCPKCKTNEYMDYSPGEDEALCTKCGTSYTINLQYK